jgi:hypothetical protein
MQFESYKQNLEKQFNSGELGRPEYFLTYRPGQLYQIVKDDHWIK